MKKLAISTALIAVLLTCSIASAAPDYSRYAVKLPGKLLNLAVEDLDGDGQSDIVAFYQSGTRGVAVYYQRKGGGFPAAPDQNFGLAADAAAFDVGDIFGTGRMSICYLAPGGMYAYNLGAKAFSDKPVNYIKADNVFEQTDPRDFPRWRFILDMPGHSPSVVVIPQINRLQLFTYGGSGFKSTGSLPYYVKTDYSENLITGDSGQLTVSHKVPSVTTSNFSGSAAQDLFVTWDDNADIFYAKPGGGFSDSPIRFRPGLMGIASEEGMEAATVSAEDMDGDGRSDLVVTKVAGGISQAKSIMFIYLRKKDGSFPAKPNQSVVTEGVIGPRVLDINGDGRKDLILPSVKMGINNFINMLTSKQINMTISIYIQGANGRMPDRPSKDKAVTFKLDLSSMGIKNARPVMAFGKFTKGNAYGLAVAAEEDRVYVYPPDRYSAIADNPSAKLMVKAPTEMENKDMNGDGIDDLVMSYRKTKDSNRDLNIFISK